MFKNLFALSKSIYTDSDILSFESKENITLEAVQTENTANSSSLSTVTIEEIKNKISDFKVNVSQDGKNLYYIKTEKIDNITPSDAALDKYLVTGGGKQIVYRNINNELKVKYLEEIGSDDGQNNILLLSTEQGLDVNVSLKVNNMMDFDNSTFIVEYNSENLILKDFSAFTNQNEITHGYINGTDLELISYTPGTIIFKKNKLIESGQMWSGIVNIIKFTGKKTDISPLNIYLYQLSKLNDYDNLTISKMDTKKLSDLDGVVVI
ncbi:hypothetical protein [Anaerovorax odorimutans]|uniref:hypothetical protein n=1 Tax=Anaerovorax odorimutans TaxID=109327 RepID=UPI000415BDC7|nr:hypothetical protein [Anaerovorax odorimutans]